MLITQSYSIYLVFFIFNSIFAKNTIDMNSLFKVLFASLALAFVMCTSSEDDRFTTDPEFSDVILTDSTDDTTDFTPKKGVAADGKSTLDILVPVRNSFLDPKVEIESLSEDWGTIEFVGISSIKSENFIFYRYRLTSEESLPEALADSAIAELKYSINVSDKASYSYAIPFTVSVIRPAVIFVHGLASGPETYDPMLGYIRPMGLYLDEALYAADYSASATDYYANNLNVVPEAIDITKSALLALGYVNEKVTLVGHSMGGILTRLYIQNDSDEYPYRDDIMKIITIDTPHSGSQLADFALTLGGGDDSNPLSIFSKMGAIVDLAVESDATKLLNDSDKLASANALKIPTHVITAHIGTVIDVAQLVKEKQYTFAAITFILNAIEKNLIYGDDSSDIVVPMSSQLGGVEDTLLSKFVTTYSNEWHCSVHTTEVAATDIVDLLNTEGGNKKSFTQDGFAPKLLTYSNDSELQMVSVSKRPDIQDVASQLVVGLDAKNNIIAASYDEAGDESLSLDDEVLSRVVSELYLAKMKSGEVRYQLSPR